MAFLTSAMALSGPEWNTEAASTASAPAAMAGGKSRRAGAARGDDRDVHGRAHQADQLQVEALLGAVGVDRVQQELARAAVGRLARPVEGVEPVPVRPPWVVTTKPDGVCRPGAPRVEREHEHLRAEAVGDLVDDVRAGDGRGVDADLVGAAAQQLGDVGDARGLPRRPSAG